MGKIQKNGACGNCDHLCGICLDGLDCKSLGTWKEKKHPSLK